MENSESAAPSLQKSAMQTIHRGRCTPPSLLRGRTEPPGEQGAGRAASSDLAGLLAMMLATAAAAFLPRARLTNFPRRFPNFGAGLRAGGRQRGRSRRLLRLGASGRGGRKLHAEAANHEPRGRLLPRERLGYFQASGREASSPRDGADGRCARSRLARSRCVRGDWELRFGCRLKTALGLRRAANSGAERG